VIIDIYSRKIPHWEIHATEKGVLAVSFIENAIVANHGTMPDTIHSDNGTSMTSKNVATLLSDLHIERSRSRPHASNDNPYSGTAFKTLKYCPAFPENFTSIYDARAFANIFFDYYNTEHRHFRDRPLHAGLGPRRHLETRPHPPPGRPGRRLRRLRRTVPGGRPTAPELPSKVWINKPPSTIESAQSLQTESTT
jgi:putative transposase